MFKPARVLLLGAGILSVTGCGDPVRTTLQRVVLRVTDSRSGETVADADVSLRYDFDHYVPQADQWDEWKRDTYKWFSGRTDATGSAEVGLVSTSLDRTIGSTPPSWRDNVTGKAYLISIRKDQISEEHSAIMQPDMSVPGRSFTVLVLEIGKPCYVITDR